jgi:chromosome transmission fidelity protein 18
MIDPLRLSGRFYRRLCMVEACSLPISECITTILMTNYNFHVNIYTYMNGYRPNCVILDEVDGIESKSSIEFLVSIIKAPLHPPKANAFALRRPLICICNDAFVFALKDLRQHCQVVHLHPPSEIRLTQRLKTICALEKLYVAPMALTSLAASCALDIRACINTLQFASFKYANEGGGEGSLPTNGSKDGKRDIFTIWKAGEVYNYYIVKRI